MNFKFESYDNFGLSNKESLAYEIAKDQRNTTKGDNYKSFANSANAITDFANGISVSQGVNTPIDASNVNGQAENNKAILAMMDKFTKMR